LSPKPPSLARYLALLLLQAMACSDASQKQQQALLLLLLTRCGRLLLRNVLLHTISFHATGARGGGGL